MIRQSAALLFALFACQSPGVTPSLCQPLSGDKISGADLAAAVPSLAAIPSTLQLGYAPIPGSVRIFLPSQIRQIAKKYGVQDSVSKPVCFAWPLHLLTDDDILESINKSLSGRRIDVEITEKSKVPVPDGELLFPLQGFTGNSAKPTLWNGYVLYGGGRKFNVWVQARVTVREQQFITLRAISTGELITLSDLKKVDYLGPLRRIEPPHAEADVLGKSTRWPITKGAVLLGSMLSAPFDVQKDQLVVVHISCGEAHVETQGVAVDPGYSGNVIRVRNTKTGRQFRAKVDSQGVVTVVAGGPSGLVGEEDKSHDHSI